MTTANSPTSPFASASSVREQNSLFSDLVDQTISSFRAYNYFKNIVLNDNTVNYINDAGVVTVINADFLKKQEAAFIMVLSSLKDLFRKKISRRKSKGENALTPEEINAKRSQAIIDFFTAYTQDEQLAAAVSSHALVKPKKSQQFSKNQYMSDRLRLYLFDAETNYGCGVNFLLVSSKKSGPPTLITREEARSSEGLEYVLRRHGEEAVLAKIQAETGHRVTLAGLRQLADVKAMLAQIYSDGIASVGTIISLLSLIVYAKGLQAPANGQRIRPDATFIRYFGEGTDTVWRYDNNTYNTILRSSTKDVTISQRIDNSQYSAIDRLKSLKDVTYNRKNKRTGDNKVTLQSWIEYNVGGENDWGFLYAGNITMATSMFTIPNEVLPQELVDKLSLVKDDTRSQDEQDTITNRIKTSIAIQEYLKLISGANKKLTARAAAKK